MHYRRAARLLVLNKTGRVLLFRFRFQRGALAGQEFWATPGGGVDDGESFEQAAIRELAEETGLKISDPGPQVSKREAVFLSPDGRMITSDERFFIVRIDDVELSASGWTPLEREVMIEHRWWSVEDIQHSAEQIWPENLSELIIELC